MLKIIKSQVVQAGVYCESYEDENDTVVNIFVTRSMIYVADCSWPELENLIEDDQFEAFEAYDLSDHEAYFLHSEYAQEITDALVACFNQYVDESFGE